MVLITEIQSLLELYTNRINTIVDKFSIKFGQKNPAGLWRQGLIDRTGFLDDAEFAFHGAGCVVEFENGEIVSFDFLEDDTFVFDLFKFEIFVSSKLPDQEENIEKIFQTIELLKTDGQWRVREIGTKA